MYLQRASPHKSPWGVIGSQAANPKIMAVPVMKCPAHECMRLEILRRNIIVSSHQPECGPFLLNRLLHK